MFPPDPTRFSDSDYSDFCLKKVCFFNPFVFYHGRLLACMRVCTRTQTCMHVRVYTCVHVVSGQSASSFARTTGAHVTARSGATARITRGHDGCGIRRMAGTLAVYLINSARYLYPLSNKTRGWCFWPVLLFADGLRADAIFGRHYSVSMLFSCRRYFWPTPLRVDATFAGATVYHR